MDKRVALQTLLESILNSKNVYFQPPASVQMDYPCIVYARSLIYTDFANDNPYTTKRRYSITIIDKNPDSDLLDKIGKLPMCRHDKHYKANNLNHDVYNLYY